MKNRLTHNLGLKILSVVIAAVVWVLIMNEADPVTTKTFSGLTVQITNDDVLTSRGYGYSVESGDKIDIKVKGKSSIVNNLSNEDFVASADFTNLNDMYMVGINVECTSEHADDVEITLKTESMAIKREEQDTEPYSIKIYLTGSVRDGYYCSGSKVSTTLVQVTGSVSQIAAVKELAVTVDIDGRTSSFTNEYEITAYDLQGNAIDASKLNFSEDSVDVTVEIMPIKEISLEVVTVGEPASGYYVDKIEFAPSVFNMAAEESLLKKMTTLIVPCDISDAEGNVEDQIDLNDYLGGLFTESYYSTDDITLGVVVTIKPLADRSMTFTAEDVTVVNLGEGLRADVYSLWDTEAVVTGPEDVIDGLSLSDLGLYIDMKDCGAGTYSRQIYCKYSGSASVSVGSVMVKLSEIGADEAGEETEGSEAETESGE